MSEIENLGKNRVENQAFRYRRRIRTASWNELYGQADGD